MQSHLDACAVMKCLGQTQAAQLKLSLFEFLLIGLTAALLGGLLGALRDLLVAGLPQPGLIPWLSGAAAGLVLLLGFALPPLLGLARVPPLRILRRDAGGQPVSALLV
ncbi:MAG: hypothetical protein MO853_10970 [Candidatus Protistobacter heckmanni]|nr:hypothetical protein [Candidatus Protistobacter heckmanni]